ncbi:hypothetical protein U9M48_042351 [Paspalum notatum var. saurae]|uniref:C3H1-type domain-containing protein n=1 Tax=Paspalum notatum var. saurae TaxID=547442 RepID=A0AAQ3UQY3_PASNO
MAAEGREDARWRRNDTDCVSFLASRFACTKGTNCEFRHCEAARFNSSCWYWFQGNCVNPSCTFRHPPLDQTKTLADPLLSSASASIKAANPCYFYYNLYCKKGDNCPFQHEPLAHKGDVGICSQALTSNLAKNDNPPGSEMIESAKDALANPCQDSPDHKKKHHPKGVLESSSPEYDGVIANALLSPVDTVGCMKSSTPSDQSLGDSEMEHTEQDVSRDSSPGFDVLVDDGLSNQIDLEHQSAQERNTEVLHVKYRIGDSIGYGLDYHDAEYMEQGLHGFEHGCYLDYLEGVQGHDCVTTFGHIAHNNRINPTNPSCEDQDKLFFDPRSLMGSHAGFDHQITQIENISKRRPKRRRGSKSNNIKRFRIHEARNCSEGNETRQSHHMQNSSIGDCSRSLVCATFRGKKKSSRKPCHFRSARSSKYSTANVKNLDDPEDFTGPKTLAQIKEEKCRSKFSFGNPTVQRSHGRSSSNDFEGPKSLSELLKAKERTYVDKGIML